MSKFEIVVWETVRHSVLVESDDRQEAIKTGFNIITTGVSGVDFTTTASNSKSVDSHEVND
jgi:hypothetical protein